MMCVCVCVCVGGGVVALGGLDEKGSNRQVEGGE